MTVTLSHTQYKRSDTWYSAAPRWTHAQERFTISEVIPQRIMHCPR